MLHTSLYHLKKQEIESILGNGINVQEVKRLNENKQIKKNYKDPIQKDSMPVPDGGFVIMRFRADNPGFWILHCHIDFHNHGGMAIVLQVNIVFIILI